MKRTILEAWCALLAAVVTAGLPLAPARAQSLESVHGYALIVGENKGGAGQGLLHFAERDAEHVAQLVAELGRVPPENTALLLGEGVAALRAALSELEPRLRAHAERGEATQLLFYYSGHARAEALNLGDDALALSELRSALLALPATLKVVVLDACQSGAFSNVKGASPAADFSFNSVRGLDTEGVAVLASSTGTELSQESLSLGASYFTHHFLVALRGAGDKNRDGRVSLDEVYRYAYSNTLADTSLTSVGSQHVTLETELRGKGDVPLSYPVEARAHLALDAALEAEVLVQQAGSRSVMAELHKAAGAPVVLALPPGPYEVTIRRKGEVARCTTTLAEGATGTLAQAHCEAVQARDVTPKGDKPVAEAPPMRRLEGLFVEGGLRLGARRDDAYTERLKAFSFEDEGGQGLMSTLMASAGFTWHRNLSAYLRYAGLEHRGYGRDFSNGNEAPEHFAWRAHGVAAGLRVRMPFVHEWLAVYAQLGAGAATVRSKFSGPNLEGVVTTSLQRDWGAWVEGGIGFQGHITHHFGTFVEGGYGYSNALENLLGDTHDLSRGYVIFGLRLRTHGSL